MTIDDCAVGGGLLHAGRIFDDGYRRANLANLQFDSERQLIAGIKHDIPDLDRRESRALGGHVVAAGRKQRNHVRPTIIRRGMSLQCGAEIEHCDVDRRDNRAGFVRHRAA